ncbi:MAG: carboxypeptidase-like regulatory domain-containing protein, partial [Cytophagales bacterium]
MKKTLLMFFFFCFALSLWAQDRTVTGRVVSREDGSSLPGVNVVVKGTTTGTVTDADGKFSILVPSSNSSLMFSFIGLKTSEIAVGDRSTIDIQMESDVTQLAEVVVTGFGSQLKPDLTGNIASVKSKAIEFVPVPTIDAILQGNAAGVYVNSQSGKLGQAVSVRVRGNSSISASNEPLYVVDGVPITTASQSNFGGATNPLVDLNPNDIESMEILKDAAAGAIYGSRAANGVVLITTKKGKSGKTQVTFNYQTGYSESSRRVKFANSEQYATLLLEGAKYLDDANGVPTDDPGSDTEYLNGFFDLNSFGQWAANKTKTY